MGFAQRLPEPPLDASIAMLWDWDMPYTAGGSAQQLERVLPQPGGQLIINLHEDETRVYTDDDERRCIRSSGSVLGGPMLRSEIIDTAEQIRVMGVVFKPGGSHALTGEDAATLAGHDTNLFDLFGHAATQLREQLLHTADAGARLRVLEQWLRGCWHRPAPDAVVTHAINALSHTPQVLRIAQLARDAGMSDRRFGLLFQRQVGMNPKQYARLLRFRAVVDLAHGQAGVNWSHVAADCGYSDQAHLSHEFRRFAGITPTAFMASSGPYMNHLPLD
jgi:AraC-like DNA-binding protein